MPKCLISSTPPVNVSVNRKVKVLRPNQGLSTDITYFFFCGGYQDSNDFCSSAAACFPVIFVVIITFNRLVVTENQLGVPVFILSMPIGAVTIAPSRKLSQACAVLLSIEIFSLLNGKNPGNLLASACPNCLVENQVRSFLASAWCGLAELIQKPKSART